MNIAYYISGKATRLCEIIEDSRFEGIKNQLKFVISDNMNESEHIRNLCKEQDIEWIYFGYKELDNSFSGKEKNAILSDRILSCLIEYNIDYLFISGHHLLSGELLKQYKDRIICFHPSLLPWHTGFSAIDKAKENGDFVVGNSAFFIDEGVDTGKVIMQSVMHMSNFNGGDYNCLLHPIVDMFYYILKALNENRMIVEEESVFIKNANYSKVAFFPPIE